MENITRGEKRDGRPTTSTTSGENRILKRRESNGDEDGEEVNNTDGIMSAAKDVKFQEAKKTVCSLKAWMLEFKTVTRRAIKKVLQKRRRSTRRAESDSKSCSINMEQVKEIGELIRVSWAKAEREKAKDVEAVEKEPEMLVDDQGIGEAGKKEWIISIIRVEQSDIIGKDFGFTQLVSSGNSGGIVMIWDVRSLTYKGRLGDERFVAVSVVALDRKLSDHCPIVLKDVDLDFGPRPFRVFDIWLEEKDIGHVVEEAWKVEVRSRRPDYRFRDKLKNVKAALKKWSKERFGLVNENIERLKNEAMKIKWDVEGDENSKFFHSYIKRRNYKSNIRGLTVNGLWCEDPSTIKAEMEYASLMEKDFSEGEILDAVRGCGGDKAPGPDDFNFKYIRKFWDILKSDFIRAIRWFGETMEISRAAEGLNAIIKEAVDKGVFRGIKVGRNNVVVSHLQYTDETIFFGEWNKENAKSLMCILKCFEEVSGLRVNYNKSKFYGVGANDVEMRDMARWMRCGVGEFPFTYLGLPIEENVRRVGAWNTVIEKLIVGTDRGGRFKKVATLPLEAEEKILNMDSGDEATTWNNWVPKKVNIFVWRALKGRLPVREELDKRGIDLDTVLCPSCGDMVESCSHSLVMCNFAMSVWEKIYSWWKIGNVNAFSIEEFFSFNGNANVPSHSSKM
ncbi:putative ribonuclease H protein [Tanacetum coccineum]|uniref:Ribonuclease H protein n=1 Tax=Tanacetum coccineum TaxID=301880 RepID=A0ABQ5I8E0_9ASTR